MFGWWNIGTSQQMGKNSFFPMLIKCTVPFYNKVIMKLPVCLIPPAPLTTTTDSITASSNPVTVRRRNLPAPEC